MGYNIEDSYGGPADEPETIVIITEAFEGGEHRIDKQYRMGTLYSSDYWQTQHDGEHKIYIKRGGVCNRDIPRDEKTRLAEFILPLCNKDQALASLAKIQNESGNILQIRIEEKI